jgi:outer membrane protein TolC
MNWQNRIRVQACVVGALAAFSAVAGATQPLDVFLDKASSQSFDAREAAATERQRSAEADAALGRLIPALSARGVYTRNQTEVAASLPMVEERLVITPLDQLDAVVQLDVPILDLASYYRYRAARSSEQGSSAQREATSIDVSRSVVRAYYQYLGATALVRSAGESVGAAEANHANVEVRQSAGAATELDLERAFANVARAQQNLADAELGVALAGRTLETLSGLAPEPGDGTFREDDLHPEGPLQGWLDLAAQSPVTRVANHQREAAERSSKAAGASVLPTLSASAQERVSNATGFAGRTTNYSLQLVLSWRLDYSVLANQRAQGAALEAQHVRLQRTERAVADAAFEAYQRVVAGVAKSRAARAEAHAAGRAATLAQDRYTVGAATQLDVTQAQREAFLASASQIQADSDLAFARAALRLAAGVPVSTVSAAVASSPANGREFRRP